MEPQFAFSIVAASCQLAENRQYEVSMITRDDVVIALSNSGESDELLAILPLLKRMGAKLISITGNPNSSLGKAADVHLDAHVDQEACPLGLAPTASTTAALALGDALAIALMSAKGFTEDDFAAAHPGGALGRKLLTHVRDVMRTGANAPRVSREATLMDGMLEMSRGRMGMTAVLDPAGRVVGVYTDGDLRRSIEKGTDMRSTRMEEVMTRNPRTIGPERLAAEAVEIMERNKVNQLLVVDEHQQLVGALNMHDLFRGKVI